jgi:phosphoglycerate kinase
MLFGTNYVLHYTASQDLSAPFDMFVNDAFGSAHRAHCSTEGVSKYLSPSVAGFLLQKELTYLQVYHTT